MMTARKLFGRIFFFALLAAFASLPAFAVDREIIQIQRDIAILQELIRQMERQVGERIAVTETLSKQNLDSTNKMNAAIAVIERAVAKQGDEIIGPLSSTRTKVDQLSAQFGGLRDMMEEINSRLNKLSQQVDDIKTHITTAPPPSGGLDTGVTGGSATSSQALFNSAFSDYNRGNFDFAKQQFEEYMRTFPQSEKAADAQYYLGAILYQTSDFAGAVKAFDMVLERFPVTTLSADAQYKKGMALLKLNRGPDAAREFRAVMEKFPNSNVAPISQARLEELENQKPSPLGGTR